MGSLVLAAGCNALDEAQPVPAPQTHSRAPGPFTGGQPGSIDGQFTPPPLGPEFDCEAIQVDLVEPVQGTDEPMAPGAFRESPLAANELQMPTRRAKPISGGTLLVTADGTRAVASDPDRDLVYIVDIEGRALAHTLSLQADDEPGRLVEDRHGQVHVVLRGSGAVVSLNPATGQQVGRREVCQNGRGIGYRAEDDSLWVACLEGSLARLPALMGGAIEQTRVPVGAHDVMIDGDGHVSVSLFRTAEVLSLGPNPMGGDEAVVTTRFRPDRGEYHFQFDSAQCGDVAFEPTVAFRTFTTPAGDLAMVHERSKVGEVRTAPGSGGYGGGGTGVLCGSSIVQSALTIQRKGGEAKTAVLRGSVLPVDAAISPDGKTLAVVAPANRLSENLPQLQMIKTERFHAEALDPSEVVVDDVDSDRFGCLSDIQQDFQSAPDLPGELTSVAFLASERVLLQSREPAMLLLVEQRPDRGREVLATITLSDVSAADTGHALFHANAGGGIACASCHPDGSDDAHTWQFAELGPRRTQHLRGGLLGSEPFHWQGDMDSFEALYREVFMSRMGGFEAEPAQIDALASWIDQLPAYRMPERDALAVARGEAIFHSAEAACGSCHAGEQLRINDSRDVGTGQPFQVPSLHGIAFHAPYMHDGCASTLTDRFGECGGTQHGSTAHLSEDDVGDLVAYLETL